MGSISKDEMKLLLRFVKNALEDISVHIPVDDVEGHKKMDNVISNLQDYIED